MLSLTGCMLTNKLVKKKKKASPSTDTAVKAELKKSTGKNPAELKITLPPMPPSPGITEKFAQIDTSLRELRGLIEQKNQEQQNQITNMEKELSNLAQSISVLTVDSESKTQLASMSSSKEKLFTEAEKLFKEKKWKQAIVQYQKYREKNKKGKFYKKAVFQIGLCFQNLKMYQESEVFFKEVVNSFPRSTEADLAKKFLSSSADRGQNANTGRQENSGGGNQL